MTTNAPVSANGCLYLITYYYPPLARARSRLYFSRYLAENGFNVKVITSLSSRGDGPGNNLDSSVKIPAGVQVHRLSAPFLGYVPVALYQANIIPCPFMMWGKKAFKYLVGKHFEPGWIVAVYPPMSDLVAAWKFHRKTGFPLAVDFRDDLLESRDLRYVGPRMLINRLWAKKILASASLVPVATPHIAYSLKKHYQVSDDKFLAVLNGYGDRFEIPDQRVSSKEMRLVYAGAATSAQKPDILIHAARMMFKKYPELASKIRLEYYCPQSCYFSQNMKPLFEGSIIYGGFLSFHEVQQKMMTADILFLSLSDNRYAYAFPGKLADYINMEKPVLAALPQGFARNLIDENGLGFTVDAGDVEGLGEKLAEMVCNPKRLGGFRQNVIQVKESFAMKHQVERLARKLRSLSHSVTCDKAQRG